MKANLLRLVSIAMFLFFSSPYADCPHCYTTAKVALKWSHGLVDTGYIPVFYGYPMPAWGEESESLAYSGVIGRPFRD